MFLFRRPNIGLFTKTIKNDGYWAIINVKMRRTYRKKKYKPDKNKFRANEKIRSEQIRVIDEKGIMLGVMDTKDAVALAKERNVDLVEVNPTAEPPVAKFLDYGKFQYEKDKEQAKQKKQVKKVEVKGIRLTFRMSDHDRETRVNQTNKFIEKGNKVKIELIMRGRENAYKEQAIEMVNQFIEDLKASTEKEINVELAPKKEGGRIQAMISVKN